MRKELIPVPAVIGIAFVSTGGGEGTWASIDADGNAVDLVNSPELSANHSAIAGIVNEVIDGQAMLKVPAFYVKTGTLTAGPYTGKRFWLISSEPKPGFTLHPAFMEAGAPLAQFWVGKYQASYTTVGGQPSLASLAGGTYPITGQSAAEFKLRADRRNVAGVTGFSIWNVYQVMALQLLLLVDLGGTNAQTKIGLGNVNASGSVPVDDALNVQATWRGIVGFWGNVYQVFDGLFTTPGGLYQIWDNQGNKQVKTTTQATPLTQVGWPLSVSSTSGDGYDLSVGFIPSVNAADYASGSFSDRSPVANGISTAMHGGIYADGTNAGPFGLFMYTNAAQAYAGTRLAKI